MKKRGDVLSMFRGDTETMRVRLRDGTKFVSGDTIRFTVRESYDAPSTIISKTVSTVQSDGSMLISILPADTQNQPVGDHFVYDVEATFKNGSVKTICAGDFMIKGDVTHG